MSCVLAALDLSEVTAAVTDQAVRLAKALGCPLCLVHVSTPEPDFIGYEAGPQVVRDQVARQLKAENKEVLALAEKLNPSPPGHPSTPMRNQNSYQLTPGPQVPASPPDLSLCFYRK